MALGERLAVSVAPVFLRIGLGVTFLWAGLGKFVEKIEVQGEDAAILANAGVIKPQWSLPTTNPSGTPAPAVPTTTTPPPAPSEPLPPTGEKPTDPPKETPDTAPKSGKSSGKSKTEGPASAFDVVTTRYQPSGVLKPYTGKEFPDQMEVPRMHGITLMLIKNASPAPGADGKPRMALVPEFAAKGSWPLTFAWAAAVSETLGGAFVLVGLFTRLSALSLACTIGCAAWLTVIGPAVQSGNTMYGFLPAYPRFDIGAWQIPLWQLVLFMGAMALFFSGPGGLSLDRLIFGRTRSAPKPAPAPKQT